jgi:hypothetical protein
MAHSLLVSSCQSLVVIYYPNGSFVNIKDHKDRLFFIIGNTSVILTTIYGRLKRLLFYYIPLIGLIFTGYMIVPFSLGVIFLPPFFFSLQGHDFCLLFLLLHDYKKFFTTFIQTCATIRIAHSQCMKATIA